MRAFDSGRPSVIHEPNFQIPSGALWGAMSLVVSNLRSCQEGSFQFVGAGCCCRMDMEKQHERDGNPVETW